MSEKEPGVSGTVFSERFKDHQTGPGHPEAPARMEAVRGALEAPSLKGFLTAIPPSRADREHVLLVHTERLYEEIQATAEEDRTILDADTVTSQESAEVAHWAAGSVLAATDSVLEGKVSNAFALVRPPGHHAKPDKAMGFCLFNNIAIAAQSALKRRGLKRVLIIDFDLHHGNGTQKIFYTSPEVLYVSTHQWPHYPGTGSLDEAGRDAGEGYTLNIPMAAGMGDAEYVELFREVVVPVGREFKPQLILVSAGFDAHALDPLGSMRLTHEGYAVLTRQILELANDACSGKVVFALEGGYHLRALEESIRAVLEVTAGVSDAAKTWAPTDSGRELAQVVRKFHGQFWSCLRS